MADSRRTNRRPFDPPPAAAAVQRGRRPWPEAPAYREPVTNWWTPARVRAMLGLYPELCLVLDGLRAVNLEPTARRGSVPTEAEFAAAAQLKADIDRAIAQLQGRDRRVASDKYRQEADEVNIAHEQRVTPRHAFRLVAICRDELVEILCGGPE